MQPSRPRCARGWAGRRQGFLVGLGDVGDVPEGDGCGDDTGAGVPDTVSEIIVSLLCDAHFHHRNVIENQRADGHDWPRAVHWRPLDPPAR